jgi:hypothetical protein
MASICSSNLTSGFIDLATYDEQEKYMYGGRAATAYFVRETRKSTWFTQVPVVLSKCSGSPAFGSEWSVQISRAGDYLLQTWLRVELPEVCITSNAPDLSNNPNATLVGCCAVRWTRNLGHALIREACLTFNDLVAARFDNYHLDFWAAFTTPASKQNGYDNMIGNIGQLAGLGNVHALPAAVLNIPLPFFYTRDSGVALPTAALPYNDMRIQFTFRRLNELLIADCCQLPQANSTLVTQGVYSQPGLGNAYGSMESICLNAQSLNQLTPQFATNILPYVAQRPQGLGVGTNNSQNLQYGFDGNLVAPNWRFCNGSEPQLGSVSVWANYAIVSNDERKRMACAPRDILIEQVQTAPPCGFQPRNVNTPEQYDIRFSHAIKVLFFAVRNKTLPCEHGNYTTHPALPVLQCLSGAKSGTLITTARSFDPVAAASLLYENTYRLANMGSDFYSLVEPYFKAPTIPDKTGYHMYSYSLDFFNLDPMGSTNYGKLTNVSLYVNPSQAAVESALEPNCNNITGESTANAGVQYTSSCSTGVPTGVTGITISGAPVSAADLTILNGSSSVNNVRYCQAQTFEFVVTAVNNNIVRISGGALGFPVL